MSAEVDRATGPLYDPDISRDIYRIKPMDRDTGGKPQDQFRDQFEKKREQADDGLPEDGEPDQPEGTAVPAEEDRVILRQTEPLGNERESPPAQPDTTPPPKKSPDGHVDLLA